ncbi:MAG: DUF3179 domain-containing protein [Acidimicrobiia bacterium]|nr:DUF3179 domain-containing protein [Acidimicrobiia bacterium]
MTRTLLLAAAVLTISSACSAADSPTSTAAVAPSTTVGTSSTTATPEPPREFSPLPTDLSTPPPPVATGPFDEALTAALDALFGSFATDTDEAAIEQVGKSGDARAAWLLSDVMRFFQQGVVAEATADAFAQLTGYDPAPNGVVPGVTWQLVTDQLIAWDLPVPPEYADFKSRLFLLVEPEWEAFFADDSSSIDWRWVSWGGVLADTRALGDQLPCPGGCIPALDDPSTTDAEGGSWYPDESIVFGVVVGDEARAYPKNIMQVHEMVNDTIGGRRLGIPYCTLCGSAQAFFTDDVPDGIEIPVLRTSGLLSRSNKVMYDLTTRSVFDTFTGEALSGPLRTANIVLPQASVVVSTWGDWKAAHPNTTIVARDGGIDRTYPIDPLRGRDDNGPIFPTGPVDARLPVQEPVLGLDGASGPVAFPVQAATTALKAGEIVELDGVTLMLDGSGLRAVDDAGSEVASHEAFWFAWSQFFPGTQLWQADF